MDKQQELFTALIVNLRAKSFDVYDGSLPPEGTAYPFIYMGDCQENDSVIKAGCTADVYQTIHVWSNNPMNRGTVSEMLREIKHSCTQVGTLIGTQQQILPDNTTNEPLLHGVIEAHFIL